MLTRFLLVLVVFSSLSARAEGIAENGHTYTVAPQLPDLPEYKYEDLSRFWRRTNRDKKELVRLPTSNSQATKGFCGTTHYIPDRLEFTPQEWEDYKAGKIPGKGVAARQEVGSYVTDTAACRFLEVAQEWTKECEVFNPDKNVCAIGWGDSSHRDTKNFEPHSVKYHGFGDCIDIRPIRKGDFESFKYKHAADPLLKEYLKQGDYKQWAISHVDDFYDREKTYKLLTLLKKMGAKEIFFRDPKMHKYAKANKLPAAPFEDKDKHANHIHACFPSNKANKAACEKFRYKRSICGPPLY